MDDPVACNVLSMVIIHGKQPRKAAGVWHETAYLGARTMTPLNERVAIITGASRGIGHALAVGLARPGCKVVVAAKSVESTEKLPGSIFSVAREIEELGGQALPVQVDVRHAEQVEAMVAQTIDRFGRIDILINNAGALWWQPLVDTHPNRFDLVMGVNVRAAFLACRA